MKFNKFLINSDKAVMEKVYEKVDEKSGVVVINFLKTAMTNIPV